MTTVLVLGGILVIALIVQILWARRDRTREAHAAVALSAAAQLGDVAPPSLHPQIDPSQCIGSGACVTACPEKQILGIVEGRAHLLNPLACVGHGACAAACPVQAISLVFGTAKRGVELPRLDETFQTNKPGVYVVGELGGMGLIRNAIRQGAEAAEYIARSGRRGTPGGDTLDAVVVGAGPGGIAATLGLMEAGLRVTMLEREAFGGTVAHYPRSKIVMTGPLEIPRYGTVRKQTMRKEELLALWTDIRERTSLPVITGELVTGLRALPDGSWAVVASGGERRAANVVLALGRRGAPRKLDVPGEDLSKVHYRLLEPEPFEGAHVLVVGGGDSAVESAIALAEFGRCASVTISYRRSAFARCRDANKRRIDALVARGVVRTALPSDVVRIDAETVTLRRGSREAPIPNDAVIVQAGGTSPAEILSSFGIETITKRGET